MSDKGDGCCTVRAGYDPCENCCPAECCGKPRGCKAYMEAPLMWLTNPWVRMVFATCWLTAVAFDVILLRFPYATPLGWQIWAQQTPYIATWFVVFTCSVISAITFRWEIATAVLSGAGLCARVTLATCTELTCWSGTTELCYWMEFSGFALIVIMLVLGSMWLKPMTRDPKEYSIAGSGYAFDPSLYKEKTTLLKQPPAVTLATRN
jgi:hypothetical protein